MSSSAQSSAARHFLIPQPPLSSRALRDFRFAEITQSRDLLFTLRLVILKPRAFSSEARARPERSRRGSRAAQPLLTTWSLSPYPDPAAAKRPNHLVIPSHSQPQSGENVRRNLLFSPPKQMRGPSSDRAPYSRSLTLCFPHPSVN
jgi:hypothetical protein